MSRTVCSDLPLIIAVSGKLGSGKDYIAEHVLLPLLHGTVSKMAFADHIKVSVASQDKDVNLRQCLEGNKSASLRRKLQIAGTEKGRDLYGPNVWVTTLENWIRLRRIRDGTPDIVIVTDCRFPNEAEWIENNNGLLIRISSPARTEKALIQEANGSDSVYNSIKNHASETSLDEYPFKYVVNNDPEYTNSTKQQVKAILKKFVDEHLNHSHNFRLPV